MHYHYFVGVDVSKATLDFALVQDGGLLEHQKTSNTPQAIAAYLHHLKATYKAGGKNTLFCWEHTSIYGTHLLSVLQKTTAGIWMESALAIKRSLGLQRGKGDQVDACRIARFAFLHQTKAKLYAPSRPVIRELKALEAQRGLLQRTLLRLEAPLRERETFFKKAQLKRFQLLSALSTKALKADMKRVETEMKELIKSDTYLCQLYTIVTSVKCVGDRLAISLIIATDEFKKFQTAKRLACYCGIAPFENTSGTSLKGKTRVSHIANKRLKAMLHMPALSAIVAKGELRDYYLRKLAEGHPKMSVINAVKNKLLQRVFACVRDNRPFVNDYSKSDM
jgi:transposase